MLESTLRQTRQAIERVVHEHEARLTSVETGQVIRVGSGVARVRGLPSVKAQELVQFSEGTLGTAFSLEPDDVGVVLLRTSSTLAAGSEVRRTGRVIDVPVGPALLGRVIDGTGRPLDDLGTLRGVERREVEREAPAIMDRAPVDAPLQTGLKVVDALVPIGRGQRQLILGDRQTGKTTIAVDTILNQKGKDVICIYCAIGQRGSAVARVVAALRAHDALSYSIVVVAAGEDPPGLQFVTPYAATAVCEYFMDQGRDVLIVYDDLTRHAHAYRELSLLLRRPPGREAYPGDIFYIHSRLLERSTRLKPDKGGGSLTALPIVETQAQNLAAYIPTNLISITDGQIYLSPDLFQKGIMPSVDVGKSVSRVGGKAQLPAYLSVGGSLRLSYTQFEEVEIFARFGTRLDDATRHAIERGRRIRELLKQDEHRPLTPCAQIVTLLALNAGLYDDLPLDKIAAAEDVVRTDALEQLQEQCRKIEDAEELGEADIASIVAAAREVLTARGYQKEA